MDVAKYYHRKRQSKRNMTAREPSLLTSSQIDKHYPVIIIGGGPAGVSALLGFLEAKISALLINDREHMGGQLASIPSAVENFALGTYVNGAAAAEALNLNLSKQAAPLLKAEVKALESRQPLRLLVGTKEQEFHLTCDYLIIATGYRERKLSLSPQQLCEQVIYHQDDDDDDGVPPAKNKNGMLEKESKPAIAIIGGGDSALLKALKLAETNAHVHIIHRSSTFRARPDVIAAIKKTPNISFELNSSVTRLLGKDRIEAIEINGRRTMAIDHLLAKIGYLPNTEFLNSQLVDASGHIPVNAAMQSCQPNILAAGDITAGSFPRIATAVGQGMTAAATVINKLFSAAQSE